MAALVGLLLGLLIGSVVGLPNGTLISDAADEGFDQLDLGIVCAFAAWIVGALIVGGVVARRVGDAPRLSFLVAAAVLALLGLSTTAVGSGTADWYYPLVVFGGPFVVVGTTSGIEPLAR